MANGLTDEEIAMGAASNYGKTAANIESNQNITDPNLPPPGNLQLETAEEIIQDYYATRPLTGETLEVTSSLPDADIPVSPDELGNVSNIASHAKRLAFHPNVVGTGVTKNPLSKKIYDFATDLSEGAENIRLGWNEFMSDISDIKGEELANMRHYMGAETDEDGNLVYPEDQTTFDQLLSMRKYASDKLSGIGGQAINGYNEILGKSLQKLSQVRDIIMYPSTPEEEEKWLKVKEMIETDKRNARLDKYKRYGTALGFSDESVYGKIGEKEGEYSQNQSPTMPTNIPPFLGTPTTGPVTEGVQEATDNLNKPPQTLYNDPSMTEDDIRKAMDLR